ncbi:MAG: hypothetical protein ACI9YB_001692 [Halioglobus sp.]|jgi:hypothetical protein
MSIPIEFWPLRLPPVVCFSPSLSPMEEKPHLEDLSLVAELSEMNKLHFLVAEALSEMPIYTNVLPTMVFFAELDADGLEEVHFSIDFSEIPAFKELLDRNEIAELVLRSIGLIKETAEENGFPRPKVKEINLYDTNASLRSVFEDEVLEEIEIINLANTRTSEQSLLNIHKIKRLKELILDNSRGISGNAFTAMCGVNKHLKKISLVGTASKLTEGWLARVTAFCPALVEVRATPGPHSKTLGIESVITLSTIRDAQILLCGHLIDRVAMGSLLQNNCPSCRVPFTPANAKPFRPTVVYVRDEDGVWKTNPVDVNDTSLKNGRVFVHLECGSIYNEETLEVVYGLGIEAIGNGEACLGCKKPMDKPPGSIVYLGGVAEAREFEDLGEASMYGTFFPPR